MDVLRIATTGSVDDGKSTLIGRLLYETNSVTSDKLEAVKVTSERKGTHEIDFSLFTDGLIAEREQGITIDVAHIYFNTNKRKYVVADTPGHVEYTRNMVTGASKSDASLILIDARHGVVEQTYRHFFISCLLRIPKVIVCINKMDLVNYNQDIYLDIVNQFKSFADELKFAKQDISFLPISSLFGDNIVNVSSSMPWYAGNSLLELLEELPVNKEDNLPSRFQVQTVIRPNLDFRGFAGRVNSGTFKVGDDVKVLPSGQTSTIKGIHRYNSLLHEANTKDSVVITLNDEVDLSRGNTLVRLEKPPKELKHLNATLCWVDNSQLDQSKTYLLKHNINTVKAKITEIAELWDVTTLERYTAKTLQLNDIGEISLKLAAPIFADSYNTNPHNGAFILIDPNTHNTVAVGFVG